MRNSFGKANKKYYGQLYAKGESFLRYPADWIVRFYNMYLKKHIPKGRILDYGCGTGNNSIFFIEKGYEVCGVDVNDTRSLIKENLKIHHLDLGLLDQFLVIPTDSIRLPFQNNFFDIILSNQVLYYLASEERIRSVCKELYRVLESNGVVFFTMYGPKNYYFTYHLKSIHTEGIYEISVGDPHHRLQGHRELVYLVRDEEELKKLFSDFECITTGYFDQAMFDMKSNFHWIFAGRKTAV